ncbi:MAG: patatin-like phospholipase family protein [Bdellovibrionales bacterium]|nr:patatin-like phospholipase family protein [Bdellovibrionales bacterium]
MVVAPRKRIPKKKKIALVLSGGGTKAAAFHIGVAYALKENGFEFYHGLQNDQNISTPSARTIQTYVGTSGGSFIASVLAAGYSLENISASFLNQKPLDDARFHPRPLPQLGYKSMFRIRPEIAKEQASNFLMIKNVMGALMDGKFPSLLQLKWLRMTGIFSTAGLEQFIREEVMPSNRFEDYRPELFIVGTQLNNSRKVVFGKTAYPPPPHDPRCEYWTHIKISDAIAASASLPVIFAPYAIPNIEGEAHYFMDGEIRETLSTHVAVDSGADLVLTSYSHQPYRYKKEIGSLTTLGLPAIVIQGIYILIEQKINSTYESYRSKKTAMNEVFRYCKEAGVDQGHVDSIMQILEKELHQKQDIDIIPIHPDPSDTKTFLAEHFSLSPKKLADVVKAGYKAGMTRLAEFEFES